MTDPRPIRQRLSRGKTPVASTVGSNMTPFSRGIEIFGIEGGVRNFGSDARNRYLLRRGAHHRHREA